MYSRLRRKFTTVGNRKVAAHTRRVGVNGIGKVMESLRVKKQHAEKREIQENKKERESKSHMLRIKI